MLDLSNVLVAAEVLKLAAQLSGDAQYILSQNIERCGNAPFVRVAGDLSIPGDLSLDWNAPPWSDARVCGLVVEGNLDVEGSLTNHDLGGGPVLLVLGDVSADRIIQGGSSWLIRDDVRVRRTFFGVYNDGYIFVGGDLTAEAVINHDHDITVRGRVIGQEIDLRHGHAWLAAGLVDDDGEVDWDLVRERAVRDEPITRREPATVDILAAAEEPGSLLLSMAIARGGDLESRDDYGNTPLQLAVLSGRLENARMLLDAGAGVAIVNANGQGLAHMLAYSSDEALVELVLSKGPPLNQADREGRTPMAQALELRNLLCIRALHARGVPLPPPDKSHDGFPYSLYLAESANVDLLAFLLENGVDLSFTSSDMFSDGYTLLHDAAWRGSMKSVELLLEAGFPPDPRDARGRTPLRLMLDLAPRILADEPDKAASVARSLLSHGADPLAKAADGRDPVDAAMAGTDETILAVVYDAASRGGRLDAPRRAAIERRRGRQ